MRPFEYLEPKQMGEAVAALAEHGREAVLLAGGTDLLVALKADVIRPKIVVNLKRIPGLADMAAENGEMRLGALTTVRAIETSAQVRERFLALAEAAHCLGSVQIRHLATVGGNLCRAAPCSETAPPLMVLGAQAHLVGPGGERTLPLENFFTGPGQTALMVGEVLTEIRVPTPARGSGAAYLRHSVRPMMDLALVNVAAWVSLAADGRSFADARIILGSVAPTPIRAPQAEAALHGQAVDDATLERAASLAADESRPITDVRGTDDYRRAMVHLFTRRVLDRAVARAKGSGMPA
jgi:aerobic carbon-monoxide dehydrogenase medium subunit